MSDHESEVSWPDSDHGNTLPLTPQRHGKRKRSSTEVQDERIVQPVTPASQRIKQLETPPDSRRHGERRVEESPSKRAALNKTAELAGELDGNTLFGSLGTRLRLHIHKQDRLLEASHRSRDVLRALLKSKDAEIASLKDEVKVYRNERETQRAMSAALRREVAHLETLKK